MKNLFPTLILLCLVFLASCGSGEPKADKKATPETTAPGDIDYDNMATELCECMEPMIKFQDKLMALMAEGNEDNIMAMQDEAMKIQGDGEACVEALEAKYGVIEGPEMEEKATQALRKACPDFMAMMEGAADPALEDIPMDELEEALKAAGEQ